MQNDKFGDRFAVVTADLEEYLVSCPPPPRANSCLRVHDASFARQRRQPLAVLRRCRIVLFLSPGSCCSVRGSLRPPPSHSLCTTPPASTSQATATHLALRDELRISRTGTSAAVGGGGG